LLSVEIYLNLRKFSIDIAAELIDVKLIEHTIITEEGYYSFADEDEYKKNL